VRKKYNFSKSNRVVIVCEFEEVKRNTIKRINEIEDFRGKAAAA
jgi:hypothetical protein